MTTYKFLASDSASAMEEVVKKLGPDALIVSTSKRGNKVERVEPVSLEPHLWYTRQGGVCGGEEGGGGGVGHGAQ